MKNFNYKRLDGFLLPGTDYLRALQEHALELEKELMTIREARSKDGNHFYQSEAKQDRSENRSLYVQIGKLEGQLEAERIKHKAEVEVLQGKIAALKENQVVEVIAPAADQEQDHRQNRPRDEKGRLLPGEMSKEEKARKCYQYLVIEERPPEEVAEIVGIRAKSCIDYKNWYIAKRNKQLQAIEDKRKADEHYRAYCERYGLSY